MLEARREISGDVLWELGRSSPQENHRFLVNVASQVVKPGLRAWSLLAGDESLLGEAEAWVQALDIADRVVFAGVRDDVPQPMIGAMSMLLFPSHREGLTGTPDRGIAVRADRSLPREARTSSHNSSTSR